ncbi:MAG: FecR family protein [Pseudomonadota bacterium]
MTSAEQRDPTLGMSCSEAASYWFVRRDGRELSDGEAVEFERWLRASPANAEELARMTAAWKLYDGLEENEGLASLRATALAPPRRPGQWKVAASGLLAASLVAGVIFGTPIMRSIVPDDSASAPAAAAQAVRYATGKGQMRTVTLGDGSTVTLNTASEILVTLAPRRRMIRLVRGQALFEVAHDAARPFVVAASDRQVTALGTIFEVRLDTDRVEVILIKGKVAVDQRANGQSRSILQPGQALVVARGIAQPIASIDVNAKLQWREGFVEFADEPLAQAVSEINRYSDRTIVLQDKELAAQRISGVFRTGDPDRFVAILGELVPIEAQSRPDNILLKRRTAPAPADPSK